MFKRYGLVGCFKLFISFLYTKLFFKNVRIIRLPFDIRNAHLIDLGNGLTTGYSCRIEAFPLDNKKITIKFGNDVQINDYVHITGMESVEIGNNVLMASKIYISDCTHGSYSGNELDSHPNLIPIKRKYAIKPVKIEDNVWIGESVSILPGVTIGRGTIIGANSVVTKNIPPNCIAVGNPAKIVKTFNFDTNTWNKI